jgi:hypothetical protein
MELIVLEWPDQEILAKIFPFGIEFRIGAL